MTVHAPYPQISVEPLVPEARRRMRRRRAIISAALVLASLGTVAGVLATRSPVSGGRKAAGSGLPAGARACGYVDLGIGWHAWANATVSCSSARTFMRSYIAQPGKDAPSFRGYSCTSHFFPAGFGYSCTRAGTNVIAIANH